MFFFFFLSTFAHAEEITDYKTDLFLNQNGVLHVTETIQYDFGAALKHGITRTIPTALPDTPSSFIKERYVAFSSIVVTRDGAITPFTETQSRATEHLQIGDPNVTISGKHIYKISYDVTGAIVTFVDGTTGIYWNAVGVDWQVPIKRSAGTLRAPAGVLRDAAICYNGYYGQILGCTMNATNNGTEFSSPAGGFAGLTIEQQVNTAVVPYNKLERFTALFMYGGMAMTFFAVVGILLYFFKFKYASHSPVIAEYEPYNDVLPMHAGYLIDGRLDARDITAAVMYLAAQGYIKIERLEEKTFLGFDADDYKLTLLKEYPEASFLDRVTNLLFVGRPAGAEITLSQLKKDRDNAAKRYATSTNLKRDLHDSLLKQGYFEQPFGATMTRFSKNIVVLFFIIYVVFRVAVEVVPLYAMLGVGVVSVLSFLLYLFSERRTALGYEAERKLKGFKLYLSVTGKDRFTFLSDPRNSPDIFVEYLPYAVAFGVEKEWANVFADVVIPQPNWYADNGSSTFNAIAFTNSLNLFSTDFSRSLRTASTQVHSSSGSSGSFGGGFSGGGGGGGGGGSW